MYYIIFFINLFIYISFSWSMYSAMKFIPKEKRTFPAWFCWMMVIPAIIGYVFVWFMLPFGIPRSFAKQFSDNQEALKHSEKIFGLGLAYVVVDFFIFLPILGIIFYIATLILFILYWVEVVKFKNNFLVNTDNETASACCYTE